VVCVVKLGVLAVTLIVVVPIVFGTITSLTKGEEMRSIECLIQHTW
jgi:uncharacterized membrane protein (DUF441 family)